jgi:hypothetical protein
MKTTLFLLLLSFCFLSCKDQGEVVEYLEVLSIQPTPNTTHHDKIIPLSVRFNGLVNRSETTKINVTYIDEPLPLSIGLDCEECPSESEWLSFRPFVWKAGRTVEVVVSKNLTDTKGRSLKEDLKFKFTVAPDSVPFRLESTRPQQNDTVSIGQFHATSLGFNFSDYVVQRDSVVSITPAASKYLIATVPGGPMKSLYFSLDQLQPNTRYEVLLGRGIRDVEGETLPHDYRMVFHTRP